MSTTGEIKQLFKLNRFPENDLKIVALVLYFPLGLLLLVLRSIFALGVILIGCTLSSSPIIHKLMHKITSLALGISVRVENPEQKDNVDVFISNSVSIFDHLVLHKATGSVSPGSQIHPSVSRGLGLYFFGPESNTESLKANILHAIAEEKLAVHLRPEGTVTNGKALLKFDSYPFELTNKVQPVCISVERPFFDIAVNTLGANFWTDVFFYMISPVTSYKVKFLSTVERKSLHERDFAEITRQNIATALKIEMSSFTASDIQEWEKRQLVERQQSRVSQQPSRTVQVDPEMRRMALQVKEVLPNVPLNAIHKDLNKTKNIDTTITNILEGRVQFIPETAPSTGATPESSAGTSSSASHQRSSQEQQSQQKQQQQTEGMFNTAASSFPKSAHERSKSFHERKEQLIANARRRYIEKNNLNLPS